MSTVLDVRFVLDEVPHPGPWARAGRCRVPGAGRLFFPQRGEGTEEAKAVCAGCPVKAECLAYALPHHDLVGIWGGTSGRERREMRGDPEQLDEPEPSAAAGAGCSPRGTLMRALDELSAHPGRWCRVARYSATSSAGAAATNLRAGRLQAPPGAWSFEARRNDVGGSDLWAHLAPEPVDRSA